jgi:hypothetical protein
MHRIKIAHVILGSLIVSDGLYAEWQSDASGSDASIWIALFGLAVVGVLALYLSSEKIKELTRNFSTIQNVQKEIETRQNVLLGVIGERLETSTHGIRRYRELFENQNGESLDWEAIRSEMTRFRRDVHLLNDAMQEMQDFSQIRSGQLKLESLPFGVGEMLKRLSRQVEPHYFLKRNELIYRLDPQRIAQLTGDVHRVEQILSILLIELSQGVYDSSVVLSMMAGRDNKTLTFDVLVLQGDEGVQMLEEMFIEGTDLEVTQHSGLKLKSYLARELVRLMGGTITSASEHGEGIRYRIVLPLHVESVASPLPFSNAPLLIVSHNELTALSVGDMLAGSLSREQIDVYNSGEATLPDLTRYETVVITYAALQADWAEHLRTFQEEYPLRLIVLKNGFERNLSIPEELAVVQTLWLPLLPEKLAEAMHKDPEKIDGYDEAVS